MPSLPCYPSLPSCSSDFPSLPPSPTSDCLPPLPPLSAGYGECESLPSLPSVSSGCNYLPSLPSVPLGGGCGGGFLPTFPFLGSGFGYTACNEPFEEGCYEYCKPKYSCLDKCCSLKEKCACLKQKCRLLKEKCKCKLKNCLCEKKVVLPLLKPCLKKGLKLSLGNLGCGCEEYGGIGELESGIPFGISSIFSNVFRQALTNTGGNYYDNCDY